MRAIALLTLLSICACSTPGLDPLDEGDSPKQGGSRSSNSSKDGGASQSSNDSTGSTGSTGSTDSSGATGSDDGTTTTSPVSLSWNSLGDFVYSLDVQAANGDWVGPCLDASVIGSATSVVYKGVCTSAANRAIPTPAAYRLYYSRSNTGVQHWQDYVEVTPTTPSASVAFNLPTKAPSSVSLSWTKRSATAQYSLDVFLVNGDKVRPCINADTLGTSTATTFGGDCTAPPASRRVDLKDVTDFVICSAEGGNWAAATCTGIPYTGFGTSRTIP